MNSSKVSLKWMPLIINVYDFLYTGSCSACSVINIEDHGY